MRDFTLRHVIVLVSRERCSSPSYQGPIKFPLCSPLPAAAVAGFFGAGAAEMKMDRTARTPFQFFVEIM
jgi:hypothetical protein